MNYWGDKPYHSLNHYLKELYGEKVYKIAINGGFTCPNRDGKLDTRGCIFCSEGGSGDFASSPSLSIYDQIEEGKKRLASKKTGHKYIAYFQAYTNTYGSLSHLEKTYKEALSHPDIVGLSIATRPDCLDDQVITLLAGMQTKKKIWVELGLQTIHTESAAFIRRGYDLACFEKAVHGLEHVHIDVVVHLILGLPHETPQHMLETIDYIAKQPVQGIKLQLLHVLKHTDLADYYLKENFHILTQHEYINLLIKCIERLPPRMVIHRITGDGPKSLLIAPKWSANKRMVLNETLKAFRLRDTYQGRLYASNTL